MRTYETTHAWLQFSMDLSLLSPRTWAMLGECQSKCDHVVRTLLQPERAQRMRQIYLAKGPLASAAIEGNTLSQEQVEQHLRGELRLPPSQQYLQQEVENIIAECNRLLREVQAGNPPELTVEGICRMNSAVLTGLDLEANIRPGAIRDYEVGVARYRGAPPEDCDYLLERLCSWLREEIVAREEGLQMVYAILRAVLAHLYLAWIHPFGDGNGRTARLVEFQILIVSGVPDPAAHLLSNYYNKTRSRYYRRLDRAILSGADARLFIEYAVEGFRDELQLQLDEIRKQQIDVVWRDYVHERFESRRGRAAQRQMQLLLDLSRSEDLSGWPGWVPISDVRAISARMAKAYATATEKTISRDINALVGMGLIAKSRTDVRVRKEDIQAFLPVTADT